MPNEEGEVVKECKAMHEEEFWNNWLREDERGEEERQATTEGKGRRKGRKRGRGEGEKEESETGNW